MPRARRPQDSAAIVAQLRELLASLPRTPPHRREEIRSEVRRLADMTQAIRNLVRLQLGRLTQASAARDRILAYLKLFVGEVIDGSELHVVSGIQEFARRIRELRVEHG